MIQNINYDCFHSLLSSRPIIDVVLDSKTRTRLLTPSRFIPLLEELGASHFARSLVWMLCRTIPEPSHLSEERQIRTTTFQKEFFASQTIYTPSEVTRDYYSVFLNRRYRVTPYAFFSDRARMIAGKFCYSSIFTGQKVLFPVVNRKRNVSWDTGDHYNITFGTNTAYSDITTSLLEVAYHRTGVRIQGRCEMRSAWKFNDLKPRYYYALGGSMYWTARYVRYLATALMDAIPSTQLRRRIHPESHVQGCGPDSVVAYWDYSNFTSSLTDLKYFIYCLVRACREIREDAVLSVFDMRMGVIQISPWDLLDEYNERVNVLGEFTIMRILSSGLVDFDAETEVFFQQNSGMLGVAGNIGFSTANHGYIACVACGSEHCVCVGDDALGVMPSRKVNDVISLIRELGTVATEKFGIIEDSETIGKFLKRGVTMLEDGSILLDYLLDMPISAYVDKEYGTRTTYPMTDIDRYYKVVSSIGSMLWQLGPNPNRNRTQLDDEDMDLLSGFLVAIYNYMHLPREGLVSGNYLRILQCTFDFCIPPLPDHYGYDPRLRDWAEVLYERSPDVLFKVPVVLPKMDYPLPDPGSIVFLPYAQHLGFMEDLGVVKMAKVFEYRKLRAEVTKRVFLDTLNSLKDPAFGTCMSVEILVEIPPQFHSFFACPPSDSFENVRSAGHF